MPYICDQQTQKQSQAIQRSNTNKGLQRLYKLQEKKQCLKSENREIVSKSTENRGKANSWHKIGFPKAPSSKGVQLKSYTSVLCIDDALPFPPIGEKWSNNVRIMATASNIIWGQSLRSSEHKVRYQGPTHIPLRLTCKQRNCVTTTLFRTSYD